MWRLTRLTVLVPVIRRTTRVIATCDLGEIVIRYDPRDMAEVRVYHQGHCLCRAIGQELADRTVSLKDIVRARSERRRQLRAGLTERVALVEALLTVHWPPRPVAPGRAPARADSATADEVP